MGRTGGGAHGARQVFQREATVATFISMIPKPTAQYRRPWNCIRLEREGIENWELGGERNIGDGFSSRLGLNH